MTRIVARIAAAVLLSVTATTLAQERRPSTEPPQDSRMVERTGRRLVQIDVTVSGPEDRIAELTRDDFDLVINAEVIRDFTVDRLCREPVEDPKPTTIAAGTTRLPEPPTAPPVPPATILFYFDQRHLTMPGRQRAMILAREMIRELIRDGNRGLVVSNASELVTFAELTSDAGVLLEAVDRLESDRQQWSPAATQEELQIDKLRETLKDDGPEIAVAEALQFAKEERWRSEKALRRFSMVLGRFADVDSPKAVVYFADTMRPNAGEHYLSLFPAHARPLVEDTRPIETEALFARGPFDAVINEAAAHGVRIYTVHAQGLTRPSTRLRDAESGLKGFALETGGEAFLGGYNDRKIVAEIRRDLSCLYVLSFDPGELREDSPLAVRVRVSRPEVAVQARGRLVIQSEGARIRSRLLSAFGAPSSFDGRSVIRSNVLPIGFSRGRYQALLQVFVPGSPVAGAVWDVGATVILDGRKPGESSGRIEVSGPGVPVVLEAATSFPPGPYAVVAVAHETNTNQVISREVRGSWPDPRDAPVSVTPISIVQPAEAAFVREGAERTSGALAVSDEGTVSVERPTAFIGLVCWDKLQKATLLVERNLVGASSAEFPAMSVEPGDDRCAYFRDLVHGGTMTSGAFTYEVRVLAKGAEVARAERTFAAQ